MNKIFKVVWSKTKECYVVVSEVAKNNGGKKKALASVLAGLAMVAAAGGMGTPVHANVDLGNSAVNISPNGTYNGSNNVGSNSIVVGFQNTTNNQWGTVAIGAGNTATENSAMALGNGNQATGGAAVAMGAYNQAKGRASVAIGNVSMASAEDSIAIGNRANSNPANTDRGSGQFSIAVGRESWAKGTDNISIGHKAETDSSGDSIAMGRESKANQANAIAVGPQADANGWGGIAMGREAAVSANFGTAIGYQSKAEGSSSVAIGRKNTATGGAGGVAIGNTNTSTGDRAIAIGEGNNSQKEDTITMGTSNTASVGGGIAIGQNNIANSGGTAGNTMIAIGRENEATAQDTVAIGRKTKATDNVAVAIGARSEATGSGAVAIAGNGDGYKTTATKLGSVAIGMQSNSTGVASTAVGGVAQATEKGASALGFKANATAESATALGQESSASIKDGVALGSQSKTTVDKGIKGFNPAEDRTNKYGGLTGNVQTSTLAAVSVGDGKNATRQITGLAAGTDASDAVNVAQLRSVNLKYAGDSGNGDVLLDDGTLKVKGSDFITTSADGTGIKIEAKIGQNVTANADGKAVAPTTNGIATTDNVTQAINNSGWKVTSVNNGGTTNGTTSEKVSPGDTVTFSAGKNIVLDQAGKKFTYSLNKDVDLTKDGSLTIGDTKVINDGLTITGGPSVTKTGINAGNKKITNVAPGEDDTDAVNVKQLKAAKTEVKAGNGVTVAKSQGTDGHDIYTVSSTGATGNTDPSKVEGGKNTTVTGDGTAATPYKVNVTGDLTEISSITNGTGSGKISFAGDQVVKVDGDNAISLDGKGGYVTGLQNKDWDITNPTVVSGRAATEDQLKKVSDGFNNTVKLAGNTGNTDTQKLSQAGGLSFGVVGANNGQYIKTTASGTDVVADLSDDAKAKLNHTFEVAPGSNNVTVTKDTTDPNKTVYKVAVANTPAAGASSTESVVKKAAATGDTNMADITVENGKNSGDPDAQYGVNVSRNAVKDAAREAVTVNNGGNTDSPITVTPTDDAANHNTSYAVTFDGAKAAKVIPLTYKANGANNQTVTLEKGLNFTNGSNTTASVDADGVVKYDLNKDVDLTKNGSLTIGDTKVNNDGVTITGGPSITKTGIDAGNKQITNVAPAVNGTDAVNLDQLKAARTVVTSNDKSVTINKTENGNQVTYDLHVNAAAGTASTWNIASDKVSGTEGTVAAGSNAAQNIADGKTVTMQAGKNLTVNQTNDGNGNASVAFALDKDLKDLTSVTTDKVTTKEIGLQDPTTGKTTTIKTDGDRITYTKDGDTKVHEVATLEDEKHIKPGSYAVQNDGSVTMTYVDGKGNDVANEEAKITGIAKNDLSNITNDGKKVITGLGSKVEAGDNVTVTDATDATTGQKTYTVSAKLAKIEDGKNTKKSGTGTDADPYKINVEGDLADINSITNGAGSGKITFGPNETVTVGGTNPINLNAKTGNIGGLTNKTFDPNNIVSGQAATEDQLKSAHDSLKASELHIAPTAVKAGSTEAKGGVVSGTENVYKYDAATKKVTLTYNDGNGTAVSDTKAVIDFSDLNIPAAGNNYSFKTNATGNIENNGTATETEVPSGKTVNFGAGKNLTIKQEVTNGNQTYTYALNKDLTNLDKVVVNGKDGKDGEDGVSITGPTGAAGTDGNNGKVGITGKDGKDAVSISGKDGVGHIGLTGPAGKDGKNATADITVKEGKAGVDGKDGVDGITRIFYNDKDGNEHQVATHDDGMKFAGDDGQTDDTKVIKKHLNNVVDIVGGADKAKLTEKNIGVNNDNGKLKVQLAKDVNLTDTGSIKFGDTADDNTVINKGGITITKPAAGTDPAKTVSLTGDGLNNGGNKVTNVKAGEANTDAVNVKQLKDKVTTVESSDSSIKVVDKNVAGQPGYDAAKGHQYDITINNQTVVEKAQTPVVYTDKDGHKLYKIVDPATGNVTFNTKEDGTGTTVQPNEVIASMNNGGDSTTTPMKLNNVGSSIQDPNSTDTFIKQLENANKNTPNGAVNVSDLKKMADTGLVFDANNAEPKTNKLGSKVTIAGTGTLATGENFADKYNTDNIRTNIAQDADGNTTVEIGLNKNLKGLESVSVPGKDGIDGKDGVSITGATGAAGQDGNNGKVGIHGKDGKDAVSISGKDGIGHIGLTGPAGKDGKDATADITVKEGKAGVDGKDGVDGITRIVYQDKDGNEHEVATHDDGMKFAGDNGQTNQDTNPNVIKKHLNNVVDIVGGATGTLTDNNIGVNADNGKLKVQLAKDVDLTKDGSLTIGDTVVNKDGIKIVNADPNKTVSLTGSGLNNGGNKVTNVKAGEADTDAVNVKQLKDNVTTVTSSDNSISVTDTNTDASKGHAYDIKINNQGVVNKAQIPVVYTKEDGTKVYKQPNGTFTTNADGTGDVVPANKVIASMNSAGNSSTDPTKLQNVGSSIADKTGTTFLDKINTAAADPNAKYGAVNVTDLKSTADAIGEKGLNFGTQSTGTNSEIHKNLGEKLEIVGGGTKADGEYDASNIKTMTKDGKVVIALDKNIKADSVTVGEKGQPGVPGKDGMDGKIGVNGKDGSAVVINGKDGSIGLNGKDGANGITIKGDKGVDGVDGVNGTNGITRIVYQDKDGNKHEVATHDDGLKFTGNNESTVNKHHLNSLVKVQGEGVTAAQSTAFQSAAGNINVVADGNDTLTVKLNKDLKGINSIKNSDNGPALNFNTGDLSVTGGNLNMGGNKITNLGKGTNDTDAVNLKQLKDSRTIVKSTDGSVGVRESENADGAKVYDLSTGASPRFDELQDEIGRTGAQGAALAALKPIQYDPLEPTQIMAGYGNYRGNSAIAMGVAHYKNESTMMHAGLAWAGGSRHMMANAGVTWKVGNRDSEAAVADRYRKGPISSAYAMQQEMASVKAQNAGLKTEVSDLKAENEQMKAQIAAMMAKLGM